jgi:hypothetical protein
MNISVYINGKLADLPPQGLNLPITYSLRDRNGININTGSRSEYAFELPSTKNNDTIFNQFYDPAINTNAQQIFLDAVIEVDGQSFFNGKCQLQSSSLRGDLHTWQGKSYKVAFFGDNADWAIRINDLLIKDIPHTVHTYDYGDNITAWYNNYPAFDYKYIPLKLKDYTTFGQLDALEDSHPALFITGLLNKIFNGIGYTMVSNFFDSDFGQRLIMPTPILVDKIGGEFGDDYLNVAANESQINYAGFIGILIFPNQTVSPLIGPNPYDTTTGVYTAPETGFYLFEVEARLTNITSTAGCRFGFSVNGSVTPVNVVGQNNLSPPQPYTSDTIIRVEVVLNLSAGDTVSAFGISGPAGGTYDFAATLRVTGEAEILAGITLDLKYIIDPTWKAIDMIRGLAHAFNLVFETNELQRTVRIEPSDQYLYESRTPNTRNLQFGFYRTQKITDITPKIDLSKNGELVSDTKKLTSIRLKWKDDSNDPTVEALNQNQSLGVLESRFTFPVNRYKKGETVMENPFFAATIVLADNEVRDVDSTKTPMIPLIWSKNYLVDSLSAEAPTQILPRLLVSDKTLSMLLPNGTISAFDGATVADYATPLNYMIDYNDGDGFQTSLSFADATVNGFPITGLMKRFYLSELIREKQGKYLELFVYWDILDIQNLTFRDKLTINNNTYILQEINTFDVSKTRSTKTYLVFDAKELNAQNDIESTIIEAKVNT